ncbi:MAG TPA: hypothetical protein VFA32_12390 [Dehalococcoidia bacterium]|jgi:hypothetical protein|nr:hypothetical protein [Dehalococcoidia bacterium]
MSTFYRNRAPSAYTADFDVLGDFPDSPLNISPEGFLAEAILATETTWRTLPDPLPLFIEEVLAALLGVES